VISQAIEHVHMIQIWEQGGGDPHARIEGWSQARDWHGARLASKQEDNNGGTSQDEKPPKKKKKKTTPG